MSQVNQGPTSQSGTRTGQMTALMRAMSAQAGPKVLRIGLVSAGRIVEERIVKQRTSVTVGPSEKAMFVVSAPSIPAQFKLFELIGNEYFLNLLDGMGGRVALQTGVSDVVALKGQAKRVGNVYQVRLTDEARGKIVIGDTTFLFQFVAQPPMQPRPRLPLAVQSGLAGQIDWDLTIIAAFSFLLHFGLVGSMYSDWMDPVVNDDITAMIRDLVTNTPPLPPAVETAETPTATATQASPDATTQAPASRASRGGGGAARAQGGGGGGGAPDPRVVAGLLNEAEQTKIAILAALGGEPATQGTMKDDNGAPVDLNSLAARGGGVSNQNSSGLNLNPGGGGGGPITPGQGPGGNLQDIRGGQTGPATTSAGTAARVEVKGDVGVGGVGQSAPVANAEAVIRGQIAGRARACYNRGLQTNPNQQGRVTLTIRVGPSGEVESVG